MIWYNVPIYHYYYFTYFQVTDGINWKLLGNLPGCRWNVETSNKKSKLFSDICSLVTFTVL